MEMNLMGTLNAHATALQIPLVLGTDRRYETDRRLVWNEETRANEVQEFVYEVSWIPERGVWRKFLVTRRKP
jgi:hypothetical protein